MMKKLIVLFLIVVMLLGILSGCGQKTLHCDSCGAEVKVESSSNMDEDWVILCEECNAEVQPEIDAILGE